MNEYPEEFERFWALFPKRIGDNPKKTAFEKWKTAIRSIDPAELTKVANLYREENLSKIGTSMIPMASTWLFQRRWERYTQEPKPTPQAGGKTLVDWPWVVKMWLKTGKWFSQTPEPGYGGCICPRAILETHGVDPNTGKRALHP